MPRANNNNQTRKKHIYLLHKQTHCGLHTRTCWHMETAETHKFWPARGPSQTWVDDKSFITLTLMATWMRKL